MFICKNCGKRYGLFKKGIRLKDAVICEGCLTGFGWPVDDYEPAYLPLDTVRVGRERYKEYQREFYAAIYTFPLHWDDEKIDHKLERYQKFWTDSEDIYDGYRTYSDLKESELYGEKIYKYPPLDVTIEYKINGDVVEFYLYDGERSYFVGTPAKTKNKKVIKILNENDPIISAELSGGHYRKLEYSGYVNDDWDDEIKIHVTLDWSRFVEL